MPGSDGRESIEVLQDRRITAAARVGRQVRRRVLILGLLMFLLAAGGIAVWMDATWRGVRTEVQERMLTAPVEAAAPMSLLFTEVERVLQQIAKTSDPSSSADSWLLLPGGQGAILDGAGQIVSDELSEQRFRDMADAASDWFWETDESGEIAYVSDRVRDASGLTPSWFKGRALTDLIDGGVDSKHPAPFLADLEDGRPFRDFVFRMDAGRGRFRWIKASGKPLYDEDKRFLGYRGTASDITLAFEAENRASAAHLRLLRAIENVSEAFALFNRDDRLIMCNGRFRSLHLPGEEDKIQPGMLFAEFLELIGRKGRVSLEGLSLEDWAERRLRLRALGQPVEQRMADGTWLRVSDHRTPEGDCIAIVSEITQFKEREVQLIDLAQRKGERELGA